MVRLGPLPEKKKSFAPEPVILMGFLVSKVQVEMAAPGLIDGTIGARERRFVKERIGSLRGRIGCCHERRWCVGQD